MVLLVELLDLACELQLHRRKDHREHTRRDHEGLLGLKVGLGYLASGQDVLQSDSPSAPYPLSNKNTES